MDVPRRNQVRSEVSQMSSLYLIVVILVLAGAILVHLSPRTQAPIMPQPATQELGPN